MIGFEVIQQGDDYLAIMQTQVRGKVIKQRSIANFGKRKEDACVFCKWCEDSCIRTTYGIERILKWTKHYNPKKKMRLEMISNRAFLTEQ